ncbi:unnamed protein product [Lactuca virosa]|uniref:Uncharacterized protein n=1 Tax=Lactuca virosa TaxID=75947 RepID=A0AAU9P1Z8_9ASTR|nr:unnamed protein product [Lactuca virosa]
MRRPGLDVSIDQSLFVLHYHTSTGANQTKSQPNYISSTGKVAKNPTPPLLLASLHIAPGLLLRISSCDDT